MYNIVSQIIDHSWYQGGNDQQYIYYICGAIIIMLTAIFIDIIYRVFRGFWSR